MAKSENEGLDPTSKGLAPSEVADDLRHGDNKVTKPDDTVFKAKKIFTPSELNQAGEDKEYFHPGQNHRFKVPEDANEHQLSPDIKVLPTGKAAPKS